MSWINNVFWKDKKRKGFILIRLPGGFHVIIHKSFTGTMDDLMLNDGSRESPTAAE